MSAQPSPIEILIQARERDLGGFSVRRILPYATHRMVGPFIFFDHMGPATFEAGQGMDVRPHPHLNLATVTYLFDGRIHHRDSLGSDQVIEPGAINWMTAGRGIVHSERTPTPERQNGSRLHGIQLWVALPKEHEEIEPSFAHHPASSLPEFAEGAAQVRLLLGRAFGRQSPVKTHSDLFYAEIRLAKGARLELKPEERESALYLVEGGLEIAGQKIDASTMAVFKSGSDPVIIADRDSRLMWLGGSSVGERLIEWNFITSSEERMNEAKSQWSRGPQAGGRFPPIPGDDREFIPYPPKADGH